MIIMASDKVMSKNDKIASCKGVPSLPSAAIVKTFPAFTRAAYNMPSQFANVP